MKSTISKEGRSAISEARVKEQTGKTGLDAKASKGTVICEYEDGKIVEAGSALQLAGLTNLPQSTVSYRLNKYPGLMKKGYRIYYKKT